MSLSEQFAAILKRATPAPWRIRPRNCNEFEKIEGGDVPWNWPEKQDVALLVAADSEEAFLGWELDGPAMPGRGDFLGPDIAMIAFARNNADAILLALARSEGA